MSINKVGGPSAIALLNSQEELAIQLGGDTNAQLAAMMLKHGHDKRAACREMRHSQENLLRSYEAKKVEELRKQADQLLEAARRQAVGKIASGGLQVAAGAVTISSASSESLAKTQLADDASDEAVKQVADAAAQVKTADGVATGLRGAATGAEGGTEYWAADARKAASEAEIRSVEADHKAEEAKRRMDDLKEDEQSARDLVRSAFDFLKNVTDAKAGIDRAMLGKQV